MSPFQATSCPAPLEELLPSFQARAVLLGKAVLFFLFNCLLPPSAQGPANGCSRAQMGSKTNTYGTNSGEGDPHSRQLPAINLDLSVSAALVWAVPQQRGRGGQWQGQRGGAEESQRMSPQPLAHQVVGQVGQEAARGHGGVAAGLGAAGGLAKALARLAGCARERGTEEGGVLRKTSTHRNAMWADRKNIRVSQRT